ncbi:SDR family oxidoreductase [Phenylobacterium sp.]|jgi:NAD(P)-dependent dehydrogenase (short-subunit alcohol dehydrogenase family)|uniref:SDR family NAD(P)-dependent oxidoreductase n=1 Tax=Phenylobacterium sp. TaxID=1871053 RepID=UPI002F3EE4AB
MSRKVAFVTGASRGIGKACAIELAAAGFDVAITARTVKEGEQREHSSTLKDSDTSALPGSLEGTTAMIEKAGGKAFAVAADLLDPASLGAAVTKVLDTMGRIDVVVHNGRYIGPGHMDRFLDTPIELLRKQMEGNVFAGLIINQLALPSMIANGGGTIVNITSGAAYNDPSKPAGGGGWGMGYGISKGAFQRIAGFLNVEHGPQGIRCFNLQPGHIATERMAQDMVKFGFSPSGAPPAVPAKVVVWLCTDPGADVFVHQNIEAQNFCHERGLMPGWEGPHQMGQSPYPDLSAYNLQRLGRGEKLYS